MTRNLGKIARLLAVPVLGFLIVAGAATASPTGLTEAVRHQLVMLPYYSIFDNLAYRVDGNTVTLYGQVTRPTLKSDAGRVVKHIEGVDQVVNNIGVLTLSPFAN